MKNTIKLWGVNSKEFEAGYIAFGNGGAVDHLATIEGDAYRAGFDYARMEKEPRLARVYLCDSQN